MERRTRFVLFALLGLAGLQAVYPLLGIGLITNDDLKFGNAVLDRGVWGALDVLWAFTRRHGRLDVAQMFSWYVPFAIDSFTYFKVVTLGAIAADVVLFALLARSVLRSETALVLALIVAIAGMQNSWEHSPLTAFPGFFTISLAYFFAALLLFQRHLETGERLALLASTAFWLLALCTYEIYVLYAPLFVALVLRSRKSLRSSAAPIAAVVVYLTAWAIAHASATGSYGGVTVAGSLSLAGFAHAVRQFTLSALPGYFYFHPKYLFLIKASLAPTGPAELLASLGAASIMKAAILAGVYAYAIRRVEPPASNGRILALVGMGALYFVAPAVLPSLTIRGQELARTQLGLPSTYFAWFAFNWMAVVVLVSLGRARRVVASAALVAAGLAVAGSSLATDFTNAAIGELQASGRSRFALVDAFLETPDFAALADDAMIYAPSLFERMATLDFGGAAIDPLPSTDTRYDNFWTFYVRQRSRRHITIADRLERIPGSVQSFTFLKLDLLPYARREALVLATVQRAADSPDTLVASTVMVFDRAPRTDRIIGGVVHATPGERASVRLRGGPVSETDSAFALDVGNKSRLAGIFERSMLEASRPVIDVDRVFLAASAGRQFKITRGAGWLYDGWIGKQAEAIAWPDEPTRLVIEAYAPDAIFSTAGIATVNVSVEVNGRALAGWDARREGAGSGGVFHSLEMNLPMDRSAITIRCGPTHVPANAGISGDTRELCVLVNRMYLRRREPGE